MLEKSIYIYRYQRRTTMSPIYFGFAPSNRGTSKLAVKTDQGELEPTEPSRFKIYVNAVMSPTYRLLVGCLGLAVSILSYPVGSCIHTEKSFVVGVNRFAIPQSIGRELRCS